MKQAWLCGQAWGNLVLQADGRVSPCCRYLGSWEVAEATDLANLAPAKKMRKEMLAGRAPAGCEKCFAEEAGGVSSKRQRSDRLLPDPSRISDSVSVNQLRSLEIHLSTLCNLRCLMCSPDRSSGWNCDAAIAGYSQVPLTRPDLEKIRAVLPHVKRIELLGGETFLGKELKNALELIHREGKPETVDLLVYTNLTVFPDEEVRELLAAFKNVEISCSVDAVEGRNEYIRFPSRWEVVCRNLHRFLNWQSENPSVTLNLETTVSAYSYGGLPALLRWWDRLCEDSGKEFLKKQIFLNPVLGPDFQSVHVLARHVRERIGQEILASEPISHVRQMVSFANQTDRPDLHNRLLDWTEKLDNARGIYAKEFAPEIYE